MNALHKAEAAAREATEKWAKALARHEFLGGRYSLEVMAAEKLCAETQRDLLAALDAARGEAVAWADDDEIRLSREYGGSFNAWLSKYPGNDTPLYAAPPAAADRVALARSWNAGYEAARAELAAPPAAAVPAEVCGACGKAWTGEKCGQAENDWPFRVCYPREAQQPAAAVPARLTPDRQKVARALYEHAIANQGAVTWGGWLAKADAAIDAMGETP